MLTNELMSIGLNSKEADVYLTTLQLGHASIAEISAKAGIIRTTTYTHIKNLVARGLISSAEKFGKVFYIAERPDKLESIFLEQEKEFKRKQKMIKDLVPQLESIYSIEKNKPTVKYFDYDDEKGLKELRLHIQRLRNNKVYNIFNYDKYKKYINKKHISQLLDRSDSYSLLYISCRKDLDNSVKDLLDDEKFTMKYLPSDRFGFLCEITIFDDYVFISRDKDALMIEDKLFGHTMGILFQTMWGVGEAIE